MNQQQNRFSKSKPPKKKKQKQKKKTMNTDIRKQGKESKNKHFHGEPKNPKQKGIKTKIKSKPIQQKNSRKSNISYPNLKKWRKTYRSRFRPSDGGRYNDVDAHRFFFLYVLVAVLF